MSWRSFMVELIHSIKLDLLDCVIAIAKLCHGMELLDSQKDGDLVGLSTTHTSVSRAPTSTRDHMIHCGRNPSAYRYARPHDNHWMTPNVYGSRGTHTHDLLEKT